MWIKQASRGGIAALVAATALCSAPLHAELMLAPDADGYQMVDSNEHYGPAYNYVDITGTGAPLYGRSRVFNCDKTRDITASDTVGKLGDDESVEIVWHFPFKFYGQAYYSAKVSSNGYITFGNSDNAYGCPSTAPDCAPQTIPQPAGSGWQTPPFIAPWFDDLDPAAGGAVYCEVRDSSPNRRIVVQWKDVAHHDDPATKFDFQAVLYESSNKILFQYKKVVNAPASRFDHGASAVVGIQGRDDAGIGYKTAVGVTDGLAIGFSLVSGGYVGIPADVQESAGVPGEKKPYTVEVFNGKQETSDFKIEQLPGALWQVELLPPTTVTLEPGKSAKFNINVTVPAAGSAAMDDDVVTFKVTDKVAEATTTTDGSNGSSTNTQNNEVVDKTASGVPEVKSIFYLKTQCQSGGFATCFQQDSDGDGIVDGSEAASSVNNAAKIHELALLTGATMTIEAGTATVKDEKGVVVTPFAACNETGTSETCAFYGFTVEKAVKGPENVDFAEGVFNYRITPKRVADGVTVRFKRPTPWPEKDKLFVYNIDSSGKYIEIDKKDEVESKRRWKLVDANTIELTLTDGGSLDGDGATNGVIVNRFAVGTTAQSKDAGDGFGSGGLFTELLSLAALAWMRRARRYRATLQ